MALTIGEANAVNTVLLFLAANGTRTSEQALAAANLLAEKAHKALGAGFNGKGDVAKVWPQHQQ